MSSTGMSTGCPSGSVRATGDQACRRARNGRDRRRTVQDAHNGDTETSREGLITAAEQIEPCCPKGAGLQEIVDDRAFAPIQSLLDLEALESELCLGTD